MIEESLPPTIPTPPKRLWSVTILETGVLIITVMGFLRGYLAIREARFLASWPGVSPAYLAVTGILVGMLGALVLYGLVRRKHWGMRLAYAAMLTIALGYWLDQIFVADHPYGDPAGAAKAFLPVNWPFAAAVTAILITYTGLVARSSKVKAYFGDENDG